jgi:hypothetical protein
VAKETKRSLRKLFKTAKVMGGAGCSRDFSTIYLENLGFFLKDKQRVRT